MTVVVDRVVREVTVEAPDWRVWAALTDPAQIKVWYAFDGAEVDYRVGGTVTFRWAEHGAFHGTVEEVDAPHRLTYRLSAVPDAVPRLGNSTRTTFTLTADGERTRVRVEETGFTTLAGSPEDQQRHVGEKDAAWHEALVALGELVKAPGR